MAFAIYSLCLTKRIRLACFAQWNQVDPLVAARDKDRDKDRERERERERERTRCQGEAEIAAEFEQKVLASLLSSLTVSAPPLLTISYNAHAETKINKPLKSNQG